MLESGDRNKDDAVGRILQTQLSKLAQELRLQEPASPEPGDLADQFQNWRSGVSFPLLRLSKDDPNERVLVSMLLRSEEDLMTFKEPMAFPIFGRGRVLYALVGKGISEANITDACGFLTGDCMCEIKQQNPGTDILMSADWDSKAGTQALEVFELPSLPGPVQAAATGRVTRSGPVDRDGDAERKGRPVAAEQEKTIRADAVTGEPVSVDRSASHQVDSGLWRNVSIAVAAGLLILAAVVFFLKKQV